MKKEGTTRFVINADDFGLNQSCTEAICEAFQKGYITDTTMVANGEFYLHAVDSIIRYKLQNKIGIHFNLTEGRPMTEEIQQCSIFCADGRFHGKVNRLKMLSDFEKKAVYKELSAQITRMEESDICVTHADSHHHIHTAIFIAPIVARVCKEHGIHKIRIHRNIGNIMVCKKVVKQMFNIWLKSKKFITTKFFGSLRDVEGVLETDVLHGTVEIMVHPEYDKDGVLIDKVTSNSEGAIGQKLYSLKEIDEQIVVSSYYEV